MTPNNKLDNNRSRAVALFLHTFSAFLFCSFVFQHASWSSVLHVFFSFSLHLSSFSLSPSRWIRKHVMACDFSWYTIYWIFNAIMNQTNEKDNRKTSNSWTKQHRDLRHLNDYRENARITATKKEMRVVICRRLGWSVTKKCCKCDWFATQWTPLKFMKKRNQIIRCFPFYADKIFMNYGTAAAKLTLLTLLWFLFLILSQPLAPLAPHIANWKVFFLWIWRVLLHITSKKHFLHLIMSTTVASLIWSTSWDHHIVNVFLFLSDGRVGCD